MKLEIRLLSIIIRLLFILIKNLWGDRKVDGVDQLRKEAEYWLDDDKLGENQ